MNERERQLTRNGHDIHLQPKTFDVLLFLLQHAGKLVGKQEVLDAVWKQAIVTESSLTGCIRQIRAALGDEADSPTYIETVPASGYRFIAVVTSLDDAKLETAPGKPARTRQRGLAVGIGLMVLTLAYFAYQELSLEVVQEQSPAAAVAPSEVVGETETIEKSIAVLAFVNMSEDPGNEYFSDGLSEELMNLLARIPGLKVIGRSSSFKFKNRNEDLRVIGQTLGVATVLEGSVRQSDDRVRIATQLIDVSDGAMIWSETYDRTITDIFAIQDEVAAAIIDALQIHVGTTPTRGRPTGSAEAYSLFLKAVVLMNTHLAPEASKLLKKAVTLDPDFAEAYQLLASSYWSQSGGPLTAEEGFALMREAAANALAINPDLAFAQALYHESYGGGEARLKVIAALERAVSENPGDPWPLRLLTYNLQYAGYQSEALAYARQFMVHDPLSPMANYNLGESLYALGRTAEAEDPLAYAYELGEGFARWFVPATHLVDGNDEVFISQMEADLLNNGINSTAWLSDLVAGARSQANPEAFMDRRIEEILASDPDLNSNYLGALLETFYLFLGFLDRYYELIMAADPNDQSHAWAGVLVWHGTVFRNTGFTAHPRYLEVVELLGMFDIWEQRGPPDFCDKVDEDWVCE